MPIPILAAAAAAQTGGKILEGFGNQKANKNLQAAYANFASGLEDKLTGRASDYENRLWDMFNTAEPQYSDEANTQLKEVRDMQNDMSQQSAIAQRQNRLQVQNELAQQGVRGGQATTLANRATGELNRNLQSDLNNLVYDEASRRQNSRLNYYSNKASTPWNELSSTYGYGSKSANSALSAAQGRGLSSAYDAQLNAMSTPKTNTLNYAGQALSGLGNMTSGMSSGGNFNLQNAYNAVKNKFGNQKIGTTSIYGGYA